MVRLQQHLSTSQILIVLSDEAVTTRLADPMNLAEITRSECPVKLTRSLESFSVHTRQEKSLDAPKTAVSFGSKSMAVTAALQPTRVEWISHFPFRYVHNRSLRSNPADPKMWPDGVNRTLFTSFSLASILTATLRGSADLQGNGLSEQSLKSYKKQHN